MAMAPTDNRSRPRLLMASQVALWSVNYLAGKIALQSFDPLTLASFRLVLAGTCYLPILLHERRRWSGRLGRQDWGTLFLLGLLGVTINQGGFVVSLNYTSVGHVALLMAIGPLLVLLLARLARMETLTPRRTSGMALSFAGAAFLVLKSGQGYRGGHWVGDLIALASTAGFAGFTVLGKRVAHRYPPLLANAIAHVVGGALLVPLAAFQASRIVWNRPTWAGWLGLAYMVLFGSFAGYLVFYRLLQRIPASQVASLNYLLPVGATLLGVLFLGERLSSGFLLSAALILAGLWLAERGSFGVRWQAAPAD